MPTPRPPILRRSCFAELACLLALAALAVLAAGCGGDAGFATAPPTLAGTGLFADAPTRTIAADALPFEPQYPLWTDGAKKSRWIALPPGTSIDASDPDHWVFPAGTRVWKEFAFATGVETRFMQLRADGTWLYATYVRDENGNDVLAPSTGVRGYCATEGGKRHDVPSVADCRACHEATRTPVLGFAALQLSSDRDPLAPNGVTPREGSLDLPELMARGLVHGLDDAHVATPPRIAARTPAERAALGYLHGNCSYCHNGDGPLSRLGMRLDQPVRRPVADGRTPPAIATTVDAPSAFTCGGATRRVVPGAPEQSTLFLRVAAADPMRQMPPLGRHLVDRTAAALIERWIREDLPALAATDPRTDQPLCTKED